MNWGMSDDEIKFDHELLDGPDYVIHEWWDETSMFDEHPTKRWRYGIECYERRYRCKIPGSLLQEPDPDQAIFDWIDQNLDRVTWLD